MSIRSVSRAVLLACQCVSLPTVLAQVVPSGPQFQVNTYTTNEQAMPAVAVDGAGNFVVVWRSHGSAVSTNYSIQGQRYDAAGMPLGGQFQVNTYTTLAQSPAVAADAAGNFVVVWDGVGSAGTDPVGNSIQGRRYDSAGMPLGGQFQINTYTTNLQIEPAVAADAAGNFVVVWSSSGSAGTDTDGSSIQGQRFDSAGNPQGSEFQVNNYTTGGAGSVAVARAGAGEFIVVWASGASPGSDTSFNSIQARLFDSTGTPLANQFQVNTYTTSFQLFPAVATAAGNFVVVWESNGGSGSDPTGYSVHAQRYDGTGTPQGGQFQVNTYTTSSQGLPGVTADAAGNFVIVWGSTGSSGSDASLESVQGQRYDAAGVALGSQFQINTYTNNQQNFPVIASDAGGNFVVAWQSFGGADTDTSNYSVQAQRFAVPTTSSTSTSSTTSTTLPPIDQLLPGRITIIKPGALAKFVAKPTSGTFLLPSVDPATAGASLRIFDTSATAGDDTYNLPSGGTPPLGWRGLGTPAGSKGYKYKGAGTPSDPCRAVVVKEMVVKAVCKDGGIALQPPFIGDVGIVLSLGTTDRYCARFGGDGVKNDPAITKRRNAPAPGACP